RPRRAGVKRAQEAVTGERGLYGQRRDGGVTDLAEHEHLRVLAEDAAQGFFIGEFAEGGDFDLRDAGEIALDRIFERDDAHAGRGFDDLLEQGVERGGFAAAGGAGDDEHAGVAGGEGLQTFDGARRQVQIRQSSREVELGGHADGGAEAVRSGDDGEADLDGFFSRGDDDLHAPFLRHVESIGQQLAHDHQTADEASADRGIVMRDSFEHAVDAQAGFVIGGGGLEVEIGRAAAQRLVEQVFNELPGISGGHVRHCMDQTELNARLPAAGGGNCRGGAGAVRLWAMGTRGEIGLKIIEAGLIVIVRAASSENLVEAAHALAAGGVRVMEITLNTPGALGAIAAVRAKLPEMLCGAGTILTPGDAAAAIEAGAQFIITPTLQLDTIAYCREQRTPVAPGCASPTEVLVAHRAGADMIKIFPAATFALPHIRAMLEEMPDLNLVPTGGVTPANLRHYFEAGCRVVAVGSNLVSRTVLETRDWDSLARAAGEYVEAIAAAQSTANGAV
ncbi:MAG: 2-dehydro-3-deoxyphosphogluconate aldolase/4-hydroxy-2-oxoglutarate aldolase, partial [Sphingomonas bacterium]|nr:2-dehydro-3-deoxyphosphogluconate aldolase/4-hydroxy-2-oxoglutarate aldolase [Sphingomonas bacterium]